MTANEFQTSAVTATATVMANEDESMMMIHNEKKRKLDSSSGVVLPPGFLDPLPLQSSSAVAVNKGSKQFWKAGDYEVSRASSFSSGGLDHIRVHPKFLHSNATSHKWALGAFAEILDNSVDEICHGATFVNIDMVPNTKDGGKMLLFEDNGGGMNIDTIRHCMSFGYSAKSKMANTIGQYGNGFKTSTMRLGADAIVLSRCLGKDGKRPTQSIGMLSYSFLRSTGKDDIVVPIIDYEKIGSSWSEIIRSTRDDWNKNSETIVQWSPFSSEADLLHQFDLMQDQGTRVIIYNLWEDDEGELELDFDTDPHDIQIRGANRDETKIEMAKKFPNSKHFLTYQHSLRNYTSILYLRLPRGFTISLRGRPVEHHNIVNDMMLVKRSNYRPVAADGAQKTSNMSVDVTMGFVKDAKDHIDVQGFNVYHKNRLIKPFWRVWNAAGSDGRGVIAVLEANFVEPAHDKQGFENTPVLQRLHTKLMNMQKDYWRENCHEVGYAPRHKKGRADAEDNKDITPLSSGKMAMSLSTEKKFENRSAPRRQASCTFVESYKDEEVMISHPKGTNGCNTNKIRQHVDAHQFTENQKQRLKRTQQPSSQDSELEIKGNHLDMNASSLDLVHQENNELKERLKNMEKSLEERDTKIKEQDKEIETIIEVFSEERNRRDEEEARLRRKNTDALSVIESLRNKVIDLEKAIPSASKQERQ